MSRRTASLTGLVLVATLCLGVLVGSWMPRDDDFFALRKNFEIFGAVYEELVTGYVEPVGADRLMRAGLEAMLNELDPYTTFIDEADRTDARIMTQGRYGGVGLNLGRRAGTITVVSPVEGASGYKQGVRAGDALLRIADQPTDSLSVGDAETLLRGEPGSTVTIRVRRAGVTTPIDFTLTRERVTPANVSYRGFIGETEEAIGYVKLERFTRDAGAEVRDALQALNAERPVQGVVLDLRDNPGGLLRAAVDVSELFVPQGETVVSTRGRLSETNRTYRSDRAPLFPDLPLVVLVNGFSASASEIVAGAVQDLDRGVVVGTTTYGKGLVQVIRSLPHNTSLKMTTATYYTPSGRSIQSLRASGARADASGSAGPEGAAGPSETSPTESFETEGGRAVRDGQGIEPDVAVDPGAPSPLEEALQRKAAFFLYANHYAARRDTLPDAFRVDDATLNDFRAWLEAEGIDYATDAERAVADLGRRLDARGYERTGDEVAALQTALQNAKDDGFNTHADDLKRHLEREIRARFVSRSRQVEASLQNDAGVDSAVTLISTPSRYRKILSPDE
jgi:carboxyl-terminal processing protease